MVLAFWDFRTAGICEAFRSRGREGGVVRVASGRECGGGAGARVVGRIIGDRDIVRFGFRFRFSTK